MSGPLDRHCSGGAGRRSLLGTPTKPRGRCTGLGLARVRGFVSRYGGVMRIDGTEDQGTTVNLWLPASHERAAAENRQPTAMAALCGTG